MSEEPVDWRDAPWYVWVITALAVAGILTISGFQIASCVQ